MVVYRPLIQGLSKQCQELQKSGRPDCERFVQKQNELDNEFESLCQLADDRRRHLEDAVCLYQYLRFV
jgi:hypothetical protein